MHRLPSSVEASFTCPSCGAFAEMHRVQLKRAQFAWKDEPTYYARRCNACAAETLWLLISSEQEDAMLHPRVRLGPVPHEDMPEACRGDYEEAREVSSVSPRAAAALLRLVIQKLCRELGLPGQNINADIGELVKRGLPDYVQQALDIVRVTGNNAVHPGQMSTEDHAEQVEGLFELVNIAVETLIAQPKRIAARFGSLPANALAGIQQRDRKAQSSSDEAQTGAARSSDVAG